MRTVLTDADALVVDDLLPPAVFRALTAEVAAGDYRSVHSLAWNRAWPVGDGDPLRGNAVYYDPAGRVVGPEPRYPTGTVVDAFVDAVRAVAAAHGDIVGEEHRDWSTMFLSPWIYPVGTALSLHRDGGRYAGAFTFFVHPRWDLTWGADLLLLPDTPTIRTAQDRADWVIDDHTGGYGPGLATCVTPAPNRLVLIGPGRPHLIRRVDENAGRHARMSIAGFFLRERA